MEFKNKYTTDAIAEKDKILISYDAFAIGEMIGELIKILEKISYKI